MANVFDVAKYILSRTGKISTFKLQKLCYYSQAWSLVWDEKPLFNNAFYAWANGPVCIDLYQIHRGEFFISEKNISNGNPSNLNKEQKKTIDAVLKAYASFTGQELSNLTHTELPWREARKGLKKGERGQKLIHLDSIFDYYSGLYAEQQSTHEK